MADKKRVMISQPMSGLSQEAILTVRENARKYLESQNYEVESSYFPEYEKLELKNKSVFFLLMAIQKMSCCDAVYFCKGWKKAQGCRLEQEIAMAYGLKRIYEK